jgi:hypothetical protein
LAFFSFPWGWSHISSAASWRWYFFSCSKNSQTELWFLSFISKCPGKHFALFILGLWCSTINDGGEFMYYCRGWDIFQERRNPSRGNRASARITLFPWIRIIQEKFL